MKLVHLTLISTLAVFTVGCKVTASTPENTQPPAIVPAPQTAQATEAVKAESSPVTAFTVQQAIQLAEQHTKGYAVDIELHRGYGNDVYDVKTIQSTYEHHVQIDAQTGQILSSYSEREFDLKPQPKITLVQAIQIANQAVAGQVLEASLDREYLSADYEVKIMANNGQLYEVKLDTKTGKILRTKLKYKND